jgi:hypothetical protein
MDHAVVKGEHDRRGSIAHPQLVEDAPDVRDDRAFADHELLGNLFVGQPPPDYASAADAPPAAT